MHIHVYAHTYISEQDTAWSMPALGAVRPGHGACRWGAWGIAKALMRRAHAVAQCTAVHRQRDGAYQEMVRARACRQVPQMVRVAAVAPGNGVLLRQIDVAQVPVHELPRELEAEGGHALDALDAEGEDAFVRMSHLMAVSGLAREPFPKGEQRWPRRVRGRGGCQKAE